MLQNPPTYKYHLIPEEMRQYHQWCVWRYEDRGTAKPTKVPYNPNTGQLMSVTDPNTWCSYEQAVYVATTLGTSYDGIGFVLTKNDPYAFIDLDETRDDTHMQQQMRVYGAFESYAERSPSGKGLHVIIKGAISQGRRRGSIEIYSDMRYMTMTGEVFRDLPIKDYQVLLQNLWEQMTTTTHKASYDGNSPQYHEDAEILQKAATAANGPKFIALWQGQWEEYYLSQSEADFAIIDMLAFYTQNKEQIERLFQMSALGQRDKAKRVDYVSRMIHRSFDRLLPPIDIIGLQEVADRIAAGKYQPPIADPVGVHAPLHLTEAAMHYVAPHAEVQNYASAYAPDLSLSGDTGYDSDLDLTHDSLALRKLRNFWKPQPLTFPTGIMGEIAKYIYAKSPLPLQETALVGALGLMAGINGRAYNVSNTGLNLYILLLATTGLGKDSISHGINSLMKEVAESIPDTSRVPSAKSFIGPSLIASGQGLMKHLAGENTRSCVSIIGEFGYVMQRLADPKASPAEKALRGTLLDLYGKSAFGNEVGSYATAQKDTSAQAVPNPAFSFIGEATPSTFYSALTPELITDGFLPRLLTIEYRGERPKRNKFAGEVRPNADLVAQVSQLCINSFNIQYRNTYVPIEFTHEAEEWLDELEELIRQFINATEDDSMRELWNRAHLKTIRTAGNVCVGNNPYTPVITLNDAQWAYNLVSRDIIPTVRKLENGEIGSTQSSETDQLRLVFLFIRDYLTRSFREIKAVYEANSALHKARIIPISYLLRRANNLAAFKKDKMQPKFALERAIKIMIDNGDIVELKQSDVVRQYGFRGRCIMITDEGGIFLSDSGKKPR